MFAFTCIGVRHSICEGVGTRHNNYVGSFFVRRPRARFTVRGEQNHTYSVCLRPPWNPPRRSFCSFQLTGIAIGAVNLRLLDSFVSPFRVFELALSLHSPPECSVSNELDIKRLSLPVHFISFSPLDVFHKYCRTTGRRK